REPHHPHHLRPSVAHVRPTPGALRLPGLRHMRNVARIRPKAASRPCVTEVRRRLAVATPSPPQSAIPRVARIRPEAASGSPTTPITFVLPWHTCAPTPGALRLPGLRHMRNVARIRPKAASRPYATEVRRRLGRRHGPATSKRDSIPRVARIRPKAASGADATCP